MNVRFRAVEFTGLLFAWLRDFRVQQNSCPVGLKLVFGGVSAKTTETKKALSNSGPSNLSLRPHCRHLATSDFHVITRMYRCKKFMAPCL